MEEETAPTQKTETANIPFLRQDSRYPQEEESDREGKEAHVAEQAVYSPKKFGRGQTDFRSFYPERIYKVPYLQNAEPQRGEAPITKGLLDNFVGSQRWLLASWGRQDKEALFRLYLQEPRLAIQSNAFWPQYSPSDLYQSNSSCGESDGQQRYMVSTLPGRPSDSSTFKKGLFREGGIGHYNTRNYGLDYKLQKVQTGASSGLRMARSTLRLSEPHGASIFRKERVLAVQANRDNYIKRVYKERNYAIARPSQLDCPVRSNNKTNACSNSLHSQVVTEMSPRCPYNSKSGNETVSLQLGEERINSPSTRLTSPKLADPIRRSPRRLGVPNKQNQIQRRIRLLNGLPYKRTRGSHGLVCPISSQKERPNYSYQMRQRSSRVSDKKRKVKSLSPTGHSKPDMEESGSHEVDNIHIPHKRGIQCNSRPIVKECSTIYRVVNSKGGFQGDSSLKSRLRSRSVCNPPKLQNQELYVPMPRRRSCRDRRTLNFMGSLESSVPVSTCEADFQGFGEDETHAISQRNSNHPGFANQAMVHGIEDEPSSVEKAGDKAATNSKRKANKRTTKDSSSRLDVIKAAYGDMFSGAEEAVDLMASPLAKSSCRDYQHKWVYFQEFLENNKINQEKVTIVHALKFFTYLFYEKKLQTGTVAKYKSAISKPLRLKFNIELNVPAVTDLFRAMKRKRPCAPPTSPDWSLNKVLIFLDDLEEPLSARMLLRKTAFLLLLATGWRISELHACVTDDFSCSFTRESILKLRPHDNFLAKNECPLRRWSHKVIRPLFYKDGQRSNLCPVKSLQEYLKLFKSKGALFRSVSGKQSPLSIFQLKSHVCSLILQADPNTRALVHDVRKYATSCALMETMQVGNLARELNWSSPAVFYRYYLTATPPLERPVVLPLQEHQNQI